MPASCSRCDCSGVQYVTNVVVSTLFATIEVDSFLWESIVVRFLISSAWLVLIVSLLLLVLFDKNYPLPYFQQTFFKISNIAVLTVFTIHKYCCLTRFLYIDNEIID